MSSPELAIIIVNNCHVASLFLFSTNELFHNVSLSSTRFMQRRQKGKMSKVMGTSSKIVPAQQTPPLDPSIVASCDGLDDTGCLLYTSDAADE